MDVDAGAGAASADAAADAAADAGAGADAEGICAGPASLGLTSGGDASYRELCAMANDVGNPDLIYRFLALSRCVRVG